MLPRGKRVLLLCLFLFSSFAEEPLVLSWKFEQAVPAVRPGEPRFPFNSLHLDTSGALTFIYQDGTYWQNIVRLSRAGNPLLQRQLSLMTNTGFRLRKSAVDSSGKLVLAGHRESSFPGDPSEDMHVIQLDNAGNEIWRHRFFDATYPSDLVHSLQLDSENNIYVGGSRNWDFFLAKLSPTGSLLWETNTPAIDANPVGGAFALALHPNGSLYVADRNRLFRFTTAGEKIWEKPTGMLHDTMRIGPSREIFLSLRQKILSSDIEQLGKFDESGELIAIDHAVAAEFEILPDGRPLLAMDDYAIARGANIAGVNDYVRGPVQGISDIILQPDGRILLSGWNGILQVRPDLSRAAFYLDDSTRFLQTPLPSVVTATQTNIYRAGLYQDSNNVSWAEIRAWGRTNSPAVPRILEHPVGTTILAGQDYSTRVRTAETPPGFELSYQWFGLNFSDPNPIQGATNSTLNLTNLQALYTSPPHARDIYVRITNSLGIVYSREAELWVHIVPNLTNPPVPSPSLPYAGERVTWRYSSPVTDPLFVQWYKDSVPIAGANARAYVITNASAEHFGHYSVYLSNAVGQSHSPAAPFTNLLTNATVEQLTPLPGTTVPIPLLQSDGAGNVIAVNKRSGGIIFDLVIQKYHSSGNVLWTTNANFIGNSMDRSPSDVTQSIAFDSDGDFYLAGLALGGAPSLRPAILHMSSAGEVIRQLIVPGSITHISNLAVGKDGEFYVGGVLQGSVAAYVLLRLNSDGELQWTNRVPSTISYGSMHWTTPMQRDSNGNILIAFPNARAIYSFREDGSTNWFRSLHPFIPFDLEKAPDGSFYLSGLFGLRPALVRVTSDGEVSPIMTLPHQNFANMTDLQIDANGALIYLSAGGGSTLPRASISRLHTNGAPVWSASFLADAVPAVALTTDAIFVASRVEISSESGVMKFDTNGVRRWTRRMNLGRSPVMAAATDTNIFTAAFGSGGPVTVSRITDHELPAVRPQSAEIIQHEFNNWPYLEARAINTELVRVRWIRSTAPLSSVSDVGALRQIPFSANPFVSWSAEVTTPGAVLVTPDYFPKSFAKLLTPLREDSSTYRIGVHGPAYGLFNVQVSPDFQTWTTIHQGTFDENATATLRQAFPGDRTNQFYRVIPR